MYNGDPATDPWGDEARERYEEQAAEAQKAREWEAFIRWVTPHLHVGDFSALLRVVGRARELVEDGDHDRTELESVRVIANAAETFGWSGVLNAIAQAMTEEERLRAECERRR